MFISTSDIVSKVLSCSVIMEQTKNNPQVDKYFFN